MESKDLMELIDRLILTDEELTRVRCRLDELKRLLCDAQIKQARYCVRYSNNQTLDNTEVDVKDILTIFGWDDCPQAVEILRGEDHDG